MPQRAARPRRRRYGRMNPRNRFRGVLLGCEGLRESLVGPDIRVFSIACPRISSGADLQPLGHTGVFFTTEPQVVRKNRSAGVSPASEPRQLLLGQHDLCRLEAGDTFFLTTPETGFSRVSVAKSH